MGVIYEKTFNTKISEYLVRVETTEKGFHKVNIHRFVANKDHENPIESINVHPDILSDLINELQNCRGIIGKKESKPTTKIPLSKKQEIQKRYLRGVSVKDLSVQFNQDQKVIEDVILEGNIEIVPAKYAKPYYFYKNFFRK